MDLPAELLAKLELLRVATRRAHPGRYAARTRSKKLGVGVDFADHRPYTPGDDLKHVDWTLYGRSGQLMVRLAEEETELNVHLLVDRSASMGLTVGAPRGDDKRAVAQRVAVAIAYVALCNLDQVRIWPFAGALGRPLALARKRAEVVRAWTFLGESEPPAGTDTLGATRQMIALGPARGVVVLVSDLLDPSWLAAVDLLRHERFDVAVVGVRSPGELSLPLDGERFDLVDGETGAVLSGVSRGELTAAREAARARWDAVEDNCRRRGVPVARTLTGDPTDMEGLLLTLLRGRGVLR
ncbi:MAG: hypothetical protein RIT28_4186 [Pseudomonadota bacterium]